jgi:FMN phosphatase YigB (HAD superfamily)
MTTVQVETLDVGVDVDGVLYDFVDALRRQVSKYNENTIYPEAYRWNFYQDWGLAEDEFHKHYADGVLNRELLWEGTPYVGAREAWYAIRNMGHRIHIVTDRRPHGAEKEAIEGTLHWLNTHGFHADSIQFSPDKTLILDKVENPEKVFFVDDRPENVYDLLNVGVRAYILNRPWNTNASGPRVNSLKEYAELVNNISFRSALGG